MAFNSFTFNSTAYNSTGRVVVAEGDGPIINFEQSVAIFGSGSLLSLEQNISLKITGSGPFINFKQSVNALGSGPLISFSQYVRGVNETTKLQKRKYDISVFLGGYQIPGSELSDSTVISYEEDVAASCDITLRPQLGSQNFTQYFGKQLIVNGSGIDGIQRRLFTGFVDIVDFDVITNKTTLRAANRRKELLDAIASPLIKYGTAYDTSLIIDSTNKTSSELIEEILPYAPFSLDFDSYNNPVYTAWAPKTTPDLTFTDSGIFLRQPQIYWVTRGRVINKVNIGVDYEFSRLHYSHVQNNWSSGFRTDGTNFINVTGSGHILMKKDTVRSAVGGSSWPLFGSVIFTELPSPGWYGGVGWVGDKQQLTSEFRPDPTGNPVTDSNNRTIMYQSVQQLDFEGVHCASASWTVTNRWTQQGIRTYNITLDAFSSQVVFGAVSSDSSYSFSDSYDAEKWNEYDSYEPTFAVGDGTVLQLNQSLSHNVSVTDSLANSNIQATIDRARTTILKSHRDNTVTCQVPLASAVQLHHTIYVNSGKIVAKGKVKSYRHVIDHSTPTSHTEFTIAFYTLGSGGVDSSRVLPVITPVNSIPVPTALTELLSRYGVDPLSDGNGGWIAGRWSDSSNRRTAFGNEFRTDTPEVGSGLTDGVKFQGSAAYTMSIPDNSQDVIYVK